MMSKLTVLLFPWLGHGHISYFLELAKALNDSDRFSIYICSTAANLVFVKKTLRNERLSLSIKIIELLFPDPRFLEVLEDLSPDLLIYDILLPWAPAAAAGLGIPSVVFITTSAAASMYHFELNARKDDVPFPFGNIIYYLKHENVKWLDTKAIGSTVFVSFGIEYFLSSDDLVEMAYGVGDRGLVVKGWDPQSKILGHKTIDGFVSHCSWSSVLKAMKFGVLIIAMPMHLNQPINARLVVEVGVILEVVRVKGRLTSHNVAEVVRQVVVGEH
ncbi:beta-D-glucosyl crocetin beta-1,6-glucosyltransferase-like protein [Tanacetum coccineum]